jgi:hypothetical protein
VLYEFGDKHAPCQVCDARKEGVLPPGDETAVRLLPRPDPCLIRDDSKLIEYFWLASIADANSCPTSRGA